MRFKCPFCSKDAATTSTQRTVIRFGSYYRRSDSRWIQRYRCLRCQRSFSSASFDPCFRQKKRKKNLDVLRRLCSGESLRRIAMNTHLNRKTVVRKFLYLGKQAELRLEKINRSHPPVQTVEFDDLITFEHTKCKPLAVTLMVEHKSRRILGFEVAKIPASGHLAKISRKKYGKRPDQRYRLRKKLFRRVKDFVAPNGVIKTDQEPHYGPDVLRHFPNCRHETHKSIRASVAGLGELKKTYRDPIFSINHTLAMLRANINRLFRRTWCTTKLPERLAAHLMIYSVFHNETLIKTLN